MTASVVGGGWQLHVPDSVVGGELACLALFACLALLACWLCLVVHLILEFISHRQYQKHEGQPAEQPKVNVHLLTGLNRGLTYDRIRWWPGRGLRVAASVVGGG